MSMNIAFLIENFTAHHGGGEGYSRTLARSLAAHGHALHVFCIEAGEAPGEVTVHAVRAPRHPQWLRARKFAENARRSLHQIEARGVTFDVVQGFGKCLGMNLYRPGGGVHAAWLRQDLASRPGPWQRALKRLERRIDPWTRTMASIERCQFLDPGVHVIANSRRVRRDIVDHYGVAGERLTVLPNGVDCERFHPRLRTEHGAQVRQALGISQQHPLLLFVANNWRLKGLFPLLQALARLRQRRQGEAPRLLVVGRGKERRWRRLAARAGIGDLVDFTGASQAIEEFYGAADLLVHPTFYDPCANVCLEALASGLPVITTACNGAAELMTDGVEGRVIAEPGDSAALAESIEELLDVSRRRRASIAARALAERHSLTDHVAQLLDLYAKLGGRARTIPEPIDENRGAARIPP